MMIFIILTMKSVSKVSVIKWKSENWDSRQLCESKVTDSKCKKRMILNNQEREVEIGYVKMILKLRKLKWNANQQMSQIMRTWIMKKIWFGTIGLLVLWWKSCYRARRRRNIKFSYWLRMQSCFRAFSRLRWRPTEQQRRSYADVLLIRGTNPGTGWWRGW